MSMIRLTFAHAEPRVICEEVPVTVPLVEGVVNSKIVYRDTGYVAIRTRPATEDEVNQWRFGE